MRWVRYLFCYFFLGFHKIGGYAMLEPLYAEAIPNETFYRNDSCGMPRDDFFHMLRNPVGSDLPWPGFFFGQSFVALWYWATDQVSRNIFHLDKPAFTSF